MIEVKKPAVYSEADWLLLQMVRQHMVKNGGPFYDPGFIRVNCEAMYYLCRIGMLRPAPGSENWDGFYRTFTAMEQEPTIETNSAPAIDNVCPPDQCGHQEQCARATKRLIGWRHCSPACPNLHIPGEVGGLPPINKDMKP
jgi:hypothetical protein